jgi:hypothetical protein
VDDDAEKWQVRSSHLALRNPSGDPSSVETVDPEDVKAIMGVWDANRKLDDILSYLQDEDDGEEEEETDPDG